MFQPQTYERKTFVVEAVQVTLENFTDVVKWCGGTLRKDELSRPYIAVEVRRPANVKQTMAYEGDWVLKAGTGFRIYTDHAFWKSFERTDRPVGPDPYQTGNVFDRPGVNRKVVEDAMPGEPKEQTEEVVIDQVRVLEVEPGSEYTPGVRLFDVQEVDPGMAFMSGEPTAKRFRTTQELLEEKRVTGLPEGWSREKADEIALRNWVEQQGHGPVENPDSPHA